MYQKPVLTRSYQVVAIARDDDTTFGILHRSSTSCGRCACARGSASATIHATRRDDLFRNLPVPGGLTPNIRFYTPPIRAPKPSPRPPPRLNELRERLAEPLPTS